MQPNKWQKMSLIGIIALILLIVIIACPIIINYAYLAGTKDGSMNTPLFASDMLAYCGSVLSFIGTVALGALALWQNKKLNDVNVRLQDYQRRQKAGLLFPKKWPNDDEHAKINPIMPASCGATRRHPTSLPAAATHARGMDFLAICGAATSIAIWWGSVYAF